MALATFSDLQAATADWLNRSDLNSIIPDFITNAEARLNSRVRTRDMETIATVTFNVDGEYTLPADYLEWRSLTVASTPSARPEFVEPDSAEFMYRFRPNSAPQYFTILGTKVKLQPAYNGSGTFVYYAKIPALTALNTTNWLLTKAPDVYLYAVLVEGAFYLKDETAALGYSQKLEAALDNLQQVDRAAHVRRQQAAMPAPSSKTMDQLGAGSMAGIAGAR